MALTVNDAIQNSSPKALDNKYGVFSSGVFSAYTSVAAANTAIVSSYRSVGLTVLINTGSGNAEYWYQAGILDGNLVPKASVVTTASPLTFTSGTVGIQVASGSQAGALAAADWTTFSTKISSVASVGGGIAVYGSTTSGAVTIKSLVGGTNITLSDSGTAITVNGATYTVTNVGTGAQLFTTASGTTLPFRSITATGGITVTQNTNDVGIGITGSTIPAPASTTTATPTVAASITIPDQTAGMLVVTMVAVVTGAAGTSSMSQRYVQYYKVGGVLTIASGPGDLIPEQLNTLTTASWTIIANGSTNNFDIQVTGQAGLTIKWAPTIQNYTNS